MCQRIDFKILLLVYKALNGLGPKYISDLLVRYEASRPLRSSGTGLLSVPRIKTKHGEAAFSFYAPRLWNKLPENLLLLLYVCFLNAFSALFLTIYCLAFSFCF